MPLTKPQIKELLKPGKHVSCEGTDIEICVKIVAAVSRPSNPPWKIPDSRLHEQ